MSRVPEGQGRRPGLERGVRLAVSPRPPLRAAGSIGITRRPRGPWNAPSWGPGSDWQSLSGTPRLTCRHAHWTITQHYGGSLWQGAEGGPSTTQVRAPVPERRKTGPEGGWLPCVLCKQSRGPSQGPKLQQRWLCLWPCGLHWPSPLQSTRGGGSGVTGRMVTSQARGEGGWGLPAPLSSPVDIRHRKQTQGGSKDRPDRRKGW